MTTQLSFDDLEQWRPIPDWEGLYEVSDQGRIWSCRKKGTIRPLLGNRGYLRISLSAKGKSPQYTVHTLVAYAFLGPRPSVEYQIDHINRNRLDNRVVNLQYLHHSINTAQGFRTWVGEANGGSKLTNKQRLEIVALYATGRYSQDEIGTMYGVTRATVSNLITGRRGAAVTGIKNLLSPALSALDATSGKAAAE